jgi:hypothetical protein
LAEENALLTAQATKVKLEQQQRQIFGVLGTEKAQVAGAGFAASGSALDILRSSASQGALAKAVTTETGAIQETSYREQAAQFGAMKDAANTSAIGQSVAGLLQLGGAGFSIFGGGTAAAGGAAGASGILDAGSAALPLALA